MATNYVAAAMNRPAITTTAAGQLTINHGVYTISAALVINDTIALCKLPAKHVPVELILCVDDLDTNGTPTIVIDGGILGGAQTDLFLKDKTTAQAGGITRMSEHEGREIAPTNADRTVGITVTTAPATGTTTGTISMSLLTRVEGPDD